MGGWFCIVAMGKAVNWCMDSCLLLGRCRLLGMPVNKCSAVLSQSSSH